MSIEKDTEEQIFDAARKLFERKGYAGTRMQDIADEADINKSMLHYYYRSKDKLFQKVFREGMRRFFPILYKVMESEQDLDSKIESIVETYYTVLKNDPYLPSFVLHEMNQNPERFRNFVRSEGITMSERFKKQIEDEVEAGNIRPVDADQFIVNIIGLCVFPFISRTLIGTVFDMDARQFDQFLERRKKTLSTFIINAVQ